MRVAYFDDEKETSYIIGINEELSKLLDACNYHTYLEPKTHLAIEKDNFLEDAVLSGIKGDKLHVVCIEKEFNWQLGEISNNFVYELLEVDKDCFSDIDGIEECETPDDVYYALLNSDYDVDDTWEVSVDRISDYLVSMYEGRVVDREEYVNFDNLSDSEKHYTSQITFDLNQIDFFENGSPEAHVLYEINKDKIQSEFDEFACEKAGLGLMKNYPDLKEYLNQQVQDFVKFNIVENNYEMIQYIDNPTIEMQKAAIAQNINALSLIKEPSDEVMAFACKLDKQGKLENLMAMRKVKRKQINRAELDEILENHKKWLEGKGGSCADLSNTNLCHAYLKNADLKHANLSNANLSDADLRGADLRSADLVGVELQSANLSNANLSNTGLQFASLYNANLQGTVLQIANLQNVDLVDANLKNADLNNANLSHAKLSWACLEHATLQYADLSFADLSGANLNHADLSNADLKEAELIEAELNNADLSRANLDCANLKDAELIRAELYHADLNNAYLKNANLKQANLVYADLTNADLSHANLNHTDLTGADLTHADLDCANLEKVTTNRKKDDFER